jgi:hypothetical protein
LKDTLVNHEEVTQLIQPLVTLEMNETLLKECTEEEIGNTLFQIGPLKAPHPDGTQLDSSN